MQKKALISGAGIGGIVSAFWLAKGGWKVVVVEKSPELRLGGQNIDFTDAAVTIIEKMGLLEAIRARHTGEQGLQFVDKNNAVVAEYPTGNKGSLTREIEILRGDLVEILAKATSGSGVDYRFATTISELAEDEDEVRVTFSDNSTESFDVVIAADGMNSSTRSLVLGDGDYEEYIGCWASYFTIPRIQKDNDWWRWYTSPTGVIAFLRPDDKGSMRASVNFLSNERMTKRLSREESVAILQEKLKGAGWECDRISKELPGCTDIFLGPLVQVKAPQWHRGRCVLVGDAAYCPTPYTGMGTTLAIIGSYVLAQELVRNSNSEEAFEHYETLCRPLIESEQKLPPGVPHGAYASSTLKLNLLHTAFKIGASWPVQKLISLFSGSDPQNKFKLPEYGELS